jgi:hypothetical protein
MMMLQKQLRRFRNFFLDKKGITPIIAIMFMVLFTVVAVVIIAGFIKPFVEDGLYSSTECIGYENYFQFDTSFQSNCVNPDGGIYLVSVKATDDSQNLSSKIVGFDLVFKSDSSSDVINVKNYDSWECSGDEKFGIYNGAVNVRDCEDGVKLVVPQASESLTYIYKENSGNDFSKVEIHPVLSSGGGNRSCDLSDKIRLSVCDPELFEP